MSAKGRAKTIPSARPAPSARTKADDILAAVAAERRMMTREERLAFIDDIRSRSKPTAEDSTDLIRRDRDER